MSDYTKYTKQEMQAYAIAKNIKENQIVIVGTGLPLIGASLAKRAVCPSCHPIVESGLMDCDPVEVPRSVGDNRFMAHCAVQWPNIRFVGFEANEWLHDEDRLVAFIGGAQIDPYGNVNSTCIFGKGDYLQPTTRFTGSGGANGIATYCNTAHNFYDAVASSVSIPVLHMIAITRDALKSRGVKCAGLLATDGTVQTGIYQRTFEGSGVELITPDNTEDQSAVMDIIYNGVKAGDLTHDATAFRAACEHLLARGAEVLILGCTELPPAFDIYHLDYPNVDPTLELALAAVRAAGCETK